MSIKVKSEPLSSGNPDSLQRGVDTASDSGASYYGATEADQQKTRIESLTIKEREILKLTASGMKDRQIAASLQTRETAVANSLKAVSRKLACTDRLELIVYAYWQGLA